MANPATPADVQARWIGHTLSAGEEATAQVYLDDGWRTLRREVADLETRMATDSDLTAEAVRVLAAAVLRVMKNPDGHKSETRSIDDASRSWTLDVSRATGELYFTDDELACLREPSDLRGKAFSLMPAWTPDPAS